MAANLAGRPANLTCNSKRLWGLLHPLGYALAHADVSTIPPRPEQWPIRLAERGRAGTRRHRERATELWDDVLRRKG